MVAYQRKLWWWTGLTLGALGLGGMVVGGGCVAIADIDGYEFVTTGVGGGGTGGTAGGGTGGTTSGGGGGGGTGPTCSDDIHNGEEEGVDCGGPTCPPCSENCTNGVDDNENDLIDCADPFCDGYSCVPELPNGGWSGPVAIYQTTTEDPMPACDLAWTTSTQGGTGTISAPLAQCADCACGSPSGGSCGLPDFSVWEGGSCSGNPDVDVTISGVNNCKDFSGQVNTNARAGVVPSSGGSCAATGGGATVDDAAFSEQTLICQEPSLGGGCSEGETVCVRTPPAPFQSSLCIMISGDVACPSDGYTEKLLLVTSLVDTRDCTACGCDTPTGVTCGGTTTGYSSQQCSQDAVVAPNDGSTCVPMPGVKAVMFTNPTGPSGGTCATSGGAPTGSATAGDSSTICCLP